MVNVKSASTLCCAVFFIFDTILHGSNLKADTGNMNGDVVNENYANEEQKKYTHTR